MNKLTGIVFALFLFSAAFVSFQFRLTTSMLLIQSEKAGDTTIEVYVAKTTAQQYKGLGGRESLDKDGMLFVFPESSRQGIVMRDMQFPIDIVWINHGKVVDVVYQAPIEPGVAEAALTPYFPRKEANLVLELPAGAANTYGIVEGTSIVVAK